MVDVLFVFETVGPPSLSSPFLQPCVYNSTHTVRKQWFKTKGNACVHILHIIITRTIYNGDYLTKRQDNVEDYVLGLVAYGNVVEACVLPAGRIPSTPTVSGYPARTIDVEYSRRLDGDFLCATLTVWLFDTTGRSRSLLLLLLHCMWVCRSVIGWQCSAGLMGGCRATRPSCARFLVPLSESRDTGNIPCFIITQTRSPCPSWTN